MITELQRGGDVLIKARVMLGSEQTESWDELRARGTELRRAERTQPTAAWLPRAASNQREGETAMQFVPLDYSSFCSTGKSDLTFAIIKHRSYKMYLTRM